MAHLFDPLTIRGVQLRNRIGVSPMCMYSAIDGFPNTWHLVHLGSRAVGGAALVLAEGTAVSEQGRITPSDLGIWKSAHVAEHRKLAAFIRSQGAVPGIQIAHAGRKASRVAPWETDPSQTQGRPFLAEEGGWQPAGASPVAFAPGYAVPTELTQTDIELVIDQFVTAAGRAIEAGYQWIEVHGAHGYLLHSFASPLSNQRNDGYGGTLEGRCRLMREVARALRQALPEQAVLAFRLSYEDWAPGGWSLDDTVQLATWLREDGVDLIDASSGGNVPNPSVAVGPGYQVPGAERIRRESGALTAAVGWIDGAEQADRIVSEGRADLVLLGREMLRDPYWPLRAAIELGAAPTTRLAVQYSAAWAHLGHFSFDPISAPRVATSNVERVAATRYTALP